MKRLTQLNPGESGVMLSLAGDDAFSRRMMAMGFVPDTPITLLRRAPMGDPLLISLRGVRLMLRRTGAERILLK